MLVLLTLQWNRLRRGDQLLLNSLMSDFFIASTIAIKEAHQMGSLVVFYLFRIQRSLIYSRLCYTRSPLTIFNSLFDDVLRSIIGVEISVLSFLQIMNFLKKRREKY